MIKRYFQDHLKRNFSVATIWIKGGSDMDSTCKKGINHILCSLLTRGCKGFNNLKLSEYVESYGAELNHEVFEDGMFISIKSLNVHFSKLFPLIDLIVKNPILSEIQFETVKKSTLDSIKKEKENPFNSSFEKWRKIVYSNHPYAFNTIGYEEDVSQITYKDIKVEYEKFKRRKKYLISNNIFIKGEYLRISDSKIPRDKISYSNNGLNLENRFVCSHNQSNQTIIMLGNQTCSFNSIDHLHLKVLESYLSYGMSSVLFKLFREKNGITYDVGVYNPIRNRRAPFLVYLSVSNENAIFAFQLLSNLWSEILFSPINSKNLYLAKEKLKSSFLINNQVLEDILLRKIQLISNGIMPNMQYDFISKIQEISSFELQNITNKYLANPFLSISGNEKTCQEIKNLWMNNFKN